MPKTNIDKTQGEQQGNNAKFDPDNFVSKKDFQEFGKKLNDTISNLGTKVNNFKGPYTDNQHRDANKNDNGHSDNKSTNNDRNSDKSNENGDNKPSYQDLLNRVNKMSNVMKNKNTHSKLVSYTKSQLKANHMNVSKATVNHLMRRDKKSIDDAIKWYKPIYQRAKQVHIQRKPHHNKKKVNVGAALAKGNAPAAPKSKPLSDYFK